MFIYIYICSVRRLGTSANLLLRRFITHCSCSFFPLDVRVPGGALAPGSSALLLGKTVEPGEPSCQWTIRNGANWFCLGIDAVFACLIFISSAGAIYGNLKIQLHEMSREEWGCTVVVRLVDALTGTRICFRQPAEVSLSDGWEPVWGFNTSERMRAHSRPPLRSFLAVGAGCQLGFQVLSQQLGSTGLPLEGCTTQALDVSGLGAW